MTRSQSPAMGTEQSYPIVGQMLCEWRKTAIASTLLTQIEAAEVDWFLRGLLGLDQLSLRLAFSPSAIPITSPLSLEQLDQLWQRRVKERIPLQYLLGTTPWRNLNLKVSSEVLIPRPETELIVDLAVQLAPNAPPDSKALWADLGTGSGAIAIGLAQLFPHAQVHAVDVSEGALAIAEYNAEQLNLTPQITFLQGEWWSPLKALKGQFHGMVSNPPYIPTALIPELQSEVQQEPHLALDGGSDGLDSIRTLIQDSPEYLMRRGLWLIEIMAGQAETVITLLHENGHYDQIQSHQDWSGIERFISAQVLP